MVAALEAQLGGVVLFDRTRRRPTLTDVGQAVLIDARRVVQEMNGLRARVEGLRAGLEPELNVVLDAMRPSDVVAALTDFRVRFPKVTVRVNIEVLGGVPASVIDRSALIGISGPLFYRVDGLEQALVGATTLLPVAAPSHPFCAQSEPIPNREASKHTQVVLTDRTDLSKDRDFAILASGRMLPSDVLTKHSVILAGLGWGNLPQPLIKNDLAAGRLRLLPAGGMAPTQLPVPRHPSSRQPARSGRPPVP